MEVINALERLKKINHLDLRLQQIKHLKETSILKMIEFITASVMF